MAEHVLDLAWTGSALHRRWLSRASRKVPLSTVQFVCYVYALFFLADGSLAIFFFF